MTYYIILLVIISNNIPLSLLIALTYHFVPNGSPFDIPNLIHLLLKNVLAVIPFVKKHFIHHLIC